VLVAVIVVMSISLTLFGIWARAVLRERTRLASQQFQLQAARLAEAGVHRAVERHAADPQYQGETWSVPADQLDKTHSAEVRIRIALSPGANTTRIEAAAEFPAGAVRRAQITKSTELPSPVPSSTP
jgi:hypothetical protein